MGVRHVAGLLSLFTVLQFGAALPPAASAQSCIAPPSGLTSWWPGDGDPVDIRGGHDATLQAGAGYGAGLVDQAFQLDGSNYVEVADDPALNVGSGDFTVDLWVRFDNTDGEQVLIEKWVDPVSGWTLTKLGSNQIQLAMVGSDFPTSSVQSIPPGAWIHFAARREGGTATVFMNGTAIVSGAVSSNLDSPESLKFGRRGDERGFYLAGRIDEVHLWTGRALSDAEIQSIHAAGNGGLCQAAVCGDGAVQGAEACDDGNLVPGDGCENDCTLSCGNGVTDAGEQCDDGNAVNGDGCDDNCTTSACGNGVTGGSEACDDGNGDNGDACKNDCTLNVCGDGSVRAGVEACDDGNLVSGDGCDANCTASACGNGIQAGAEACDDGNTDNEDACKNDCSANVCGDGFPNTGVEACDDGNLVDGDGCDNDCTVSCGNGVTSPPETCDDGNATDGDGCDSNCTVTACGNGILTAGEACDDGNASEDDACRSDCTENVCGDGFLNAAQETCDDGNVLDGDGCDSDCTVSGPCAAPPAGLTAWWTGDGSGADIEGGHDAEPRNGAVFGVGRARQAFLLDGVNDFVDIADNVAVDVGLGDFTVDLWVNFSSTTGEQVLVEKWVEWFGDASSGWTLTKLDNNVLRLATPQDSIDTRRLTLPAATWIHFAARRSAGIVEIFMNGASVAEGDAPGDLSSSSSLKFGHRGAPSDTPGSLDTRGFFLEGRVDEVHLVVGRALSDAEIQAIVAAGRSGLCVPVPVCGNALVEAGEACDDGNPVDGDGCENDCTPSCGNGVADAGEHCDDGNAVSGDGCDTNCTASACGNGIAAGSEECEDGNATDGDGCDTNCTATACGNGIRTATTDEDCDDGNAVDGDGCDGDCTPTPVVETVAPGGTVTTDPGGGGATPQAPLQTSLTTPAGGEVTIATSTQPLTPDNVMALIRDLLIDAPPASWQVPLTIALTVDASAIPDGVDLLRVDLIRDGVVVEDCTGAPGTADPDPCIQSRELLLDGDVRITGLTSHASLWGVGVEALGSDEQKCATGIAKSGVGVVKAQAKAAADCLKDAIAGAESDPQACLQADSNGRILDSEARTIEFAAAKCDPPPPFGFSAASTVNTAAGQAALAVVSDLLGDDLTAVVAMDKAGANCQTASLKALQRLFALDARLFLDCESSGLAGDTALIVSKPQLAACFDGLSTEEKLLKAVGKLGRAVADKCGDDAATLLPGACGGARNVAYCLRTRVDCRLCRMFNSMKDLGRDCDVFDDGTANGSCS